MEKIPPPDRHHIWHYRKDYQTGIFHTLRTQHLMIPTLKYDNHHSQYPYSLHANVPAPPKPNEQLAHMAIDYLQPFTGRINHLEAIERLAYHLADFDELGNMIAQNLMEQLVFIEPGYIDGKA